MQVTDETSEDDALLIALNWPRSTLVVTCAIHVENDIVRAKIAVQGASWGGWRLCRPIPALVPSCYNPLPTEDAGNRDEYLL
jgi:hypothetical protein